MNESNTTPDPKWLCPDCGNGPEFNHRGCIVFRHMSGFNEWLESVDGKQCCNPRSIRECSEADAEKYLRDRCQTAFLAGADRAEPPLQTPFDTCPTCEALARAVMMHLRAPVGVRWTARLAVEDKMRECKCEHWQVCPTCKPDMFDDSGNMLTFPPPPSKETLEDVGHRLALELECLLLDTKDLPTVSRWWSSGMEALEEWQRLFPYNGPRLGD